MGDTPPVGQQCVEWGEDHLALEVTCECTVDYTGETCETEITFCTDDTCDNGDCEEEMGGNGTSCSCYGGYAGDRCEVDLEYCSVNPDYCKNGGECVEGPGTEITCNCTKAVTFEGLTCADPFCPSGYCGDYGDCLVGDDGVSCDCNFGHTGDLCEINIDLCEPETCQNNGTCIDGSGLKVTCICPIDFTGGNCETELLFCDENICGDNGVCMEEKGGNGTYCVCNEGYSGDVCENDDDYCGSPTNAGYCKNGGECVEGPGIEISCNCTNAVIYQGKTCEDAFCPEDYCSDFGVCNVYEDQIVNCTCDAGHMGERCEFNVNVCLPNTCLNNGTCVDGNGTDFTCVCTPNWTGTDCDIPLCLEDSCSNNGDCTVVESSIECSCYLGYTGNTCNTVVSACETLEPCLNGGSCSDAPGYNYTCSCLPEYTDVNCTTMQCTGDSCSGNGECSVNAGDSITCLCNDGYTGDTCDTFLPCFSNPCLNGGSCVVAGDSYTCNCTEGYGGTNCSLAIDSTCTADSDCPNSMFCFLNCSSDYYPPHQTLLERPVTLQGLSYINVEDSKIIDFSLKTFSIIIPFEQEIANRGYLLYYGTAANQRNFAIFMDNNSSRIIFYYTNSATERQSVILDWSWNGEGVQHLGISVDVPLKVANFYLNGEVMDGSVRTLEDPDFTSGITADNPAVLFIGARPPHYFRFSGTIHQVVAFDRTLEPDFFKQFYNEFDSLVSAEGQCMSSMEEDSSCPAPSTAPSGLCVSSMNKCNSSLACLPNVDGSYSCKQAPPKCTSNSDCAPTPGYFCGSELPSNGNYYSNSDNAFPGENMFLQESPVLFNGEDIVRLPGDDHPNLSSDLSIFAVVQQDEGNDGYVVGKGINDQLRDFGLYLRSSRKTIWLAYGSDEEGEGFREIIFFSNVSVADGSYHSVGAVIDSAANRAVLYIDGVPVANRAPLPSTPVFRPGYNILYVGGRPGTKYFRFKGTIRNLFVSTGALQGDNIKGLHDDALGTEGVVGSLNLLSPKTSRYCYQYQSLGDECHVGGGDGNNFRCSSEYECTPLPSSVTPLDLPLASASYNVKGFCRLPCNCTNDIDYQCGRDGNTYMNECQLSCRNEIAIHTGPCKSYTDLYSNDNC